jgi:hypothetical protein
MSTDMFPQGFIDYMIAEHNKEQLSKVRAIVSEWTNTANERTKAAVAAECMAELDELLSHRFVP